MKHNYLLYLFLFFLIIFRSVFIGAVNNIGYLIFNNKEDLTSKVLSNKVEELEEEYNDLLDFKNNINISSNYILSNVYKSNYSYEGLLINGDDYKIGDEVITTEGLIGIIKKTYLNYSEIAYIYDCQIPVKIKSYEGKITGKDENNNLIIKELTNYNNIDVNDKIYSTNNTYIGKVIKVNKGVIDTSVISQTVNVKNINYVAVISRQVW